MPFSRIGGVFLDVCPKPMGGPIRGSIHLTRRSQRIDRLWLRLRLLVTLGVLEHPVLSDHSFPGGWWARKRQTGFLGKNRPMMPFRSLEGRIVDLNDVLPCLGLLLASGLTAPLLAQGEAAGPALRVHLRLAPDQGSTRHSEGDLLRLADGRLLFVWTRFEAGTGGDHDPACLVASTAPSPEGPWSEPRVVVAPSDGLNVMSVTLRRLPDGRIALFHLRKRSLTDCRPVVRFSSDEAETWSAPVEIVPSDDVGYDVLNNDRVLQLEDGTLLVPIARHAGNGVGERFEAAGRLRVHRSTDGGATWLTGAWAPETPGVVLQEPGLFAEGDELLMHARSDAGAHHLARSADGGRSWSQPRLWTLRSPLSPATIERLPGGDLLAVWNEPADGVDAARAPRTPLVAARSADGGRSWGPRRVLLDDPHGWYCYGALLVEGPRMLLATCAGDRRTGNGLQTTVLGEAPLPDQATPLPDSDR